MYWKDTLRIVQFLHQDLQGIDCISRNFNLTTSPHLQRFQCWKTIFKTEVCSCSGCPSDAMLWIKEIEVATSVDDLMTSQSIEGHEFRIFEMLDAKKASSLKKIISHPYLKGESAWKSKKLKHKTDFFEEDRLLSGSTNISELLALMKLLLILQIYSVFLYKATTFKIFDTRWDQASEILKDHVLESLYKTRIRESVSSRPF